jgi:phosphoesterase RecJ-like protein
MQNDKIFQSFIKKSQTIIISTHIYPDADGIGSQIALAYALKKLGKTVLCVNEEPLPERYRYLESQTRVLGYREYEQSQEVDGDADLFIIVDAHSPQRIGENMRRVCGQARNFLYIDHHPCPREIAAIHCIDTKAAATGELVGGLIESMGIQFNQDLALPLYTSVLIDTSSFRYPTVTANTHRLIGKLLDTGIGPSKAYYGIYGTKTIGHMHFLGAILSKAQVNKTGEVAWIILCEKMLIDYDIDPEDTYSYINHLLILENIKVACMFREEGKKVKVSLRSTGNTDVGLIAEAIGGGGHNHSAATLLTGELGDIQERVIEKIERILHGVGEKS